MNAVDRLIALIASAPTPEAAASEIFREFIVIQRDPEAAERLEALRRDLRRSGHSV